MPVEEAHHRRGPRCDSEAASPVWPTETFAGFDGGRLGQRPKEARRDQLALNFHTWRSLARESRFPADQAAEMMARIVRCAG